MNRTKLAVLMLACVVGVGGAMIYLSAPPSCTVVNGTKTVEVDASRLTRGSVGTYCYRDAAGKKLRFLLARGLDGKLSAVFDACRQCFVYHRGYEIAGNELICRVCGTHYKLQHIEDGKASCVPVSLAHTASAESLTIKVSDLKSGSVWF